MIDPGQPTQAQIETAAKAMWDSEPVIYSWGPRERSDVSWDDAIKRELIGVSIFRRFAKAALTAAAQVGECNPVQDAELSCKQPLRSDGRTVGANPATGAAAQVGEPLLNARKLREAAIDATIERCAQVAERAEEESNGLEIADAIRKLKDAP